MKTELRLRPHTVIPGQSVVELWHDGELIGTVTGANGPSVRIISKHPIGVVTAVEDQPMHLVEVRINDSAQPSKPTR